jgi:SAM-dependent methyltransferase
MKFEKYHKHGAYHWKQYETGTKYRKHVNRVQDWVKEKIVLDVGAGDGLVTAILDCQGIDNEPEAVRLAQEKGANVKLGDAYNLPFKDGEFQSILMLDVLEHLEWPRVALAEARRVLTKYLYISTPPKRDDGKLTDKFHIVEWTAEELQMLVEKVGFKLEDSIVAYPEEKIMYGKFKKT